MSIRFGIDCDGVLADFGREVVKRANNLLSKGLPPDYVTAHWDYTDVMTKEEWKLIWQDIINTQNFWLKEKALAGVTPLRHFLQDFHPDAECYFITSRAESAGASVLRQTCDWLEKYGLWPRFSRSIVVPVENAAKKLEVCHELDLPFFLDDYAPTVQELQTLPNMKAFLLDAKYNQYAAHLPRVESVAQYLQIIEDSCKS